MDSKIAIIEMIIETQPHFFRSFIKETTPIIHPNENKHNPTIINNLTIVTVCELREVR